MEYPKHITDEIDKYEGKSVFYFLEIDAEEKIYTYKFGITTQCGNRLRTHCRKLNIKRVVRIIDCTYDSVMRFVETEFKRYAKSIGVMVTKFENTEILVTDEIGLYVDRVEKAVIKELSKPQPKNARENTSKVIVNTNIITCKSRCDNCGKAFRTPADLLRHKNRKIPCIIREISEDDKDNPLRCGYCNKIFSKVNNLNQHFGRCKIKNGKIPTLHDVVKLEGDVRTLYEEISKQNKDIKAMMSVLQSQLDRNTAAIEEIRIEAKNHREIK